MYVFCGTHILIKCNKKGIMIHKCCFSFQFSFFCFILIFLIFPLLAPIFLPLFLLGLFSLPSSMPPFISFCSVLALLFLAHFIRFSFFDQFFLLSLLLLSSYHLVFSISSHSFIPESSSHSRRSHIFLKFQSGWNAAFVAKREVTEKSLADTRIVVATPKSEIILGIISTRSLSHTTTSSTTVPGTSAEFSFLDECTARWSTLSQKPALTITYHQMVKKWWETSRIIGITLSVW